METLLHLAVWVAIFVFMLRYGCSLHAAGNGKMTRHGSEVRRSTGTTKLKWISPDSDVDPVCRRKINTNTAKTNVYKGDVYHFCSRDCREIFEAAPQLYTEPLETKRKFLEQEHV